MKITRKEYFYVIVSFVFIGLLGTLEVNSFKAHAQNCLIANINGLDWAICENEQGEAVVQQNYKEFKELQVKNNKLISQ